MDTKDYVVTTLAGPKVAGLAASAGATLKLTEAQARHELLAGAIVPADKVKDKETPDPLAGTGRLAGIQARAKGGERAGDEPAEEPSQSLAPPADPGPTDPPGGKAPAKPADGKPAETKSPQA